MPLPMTASPAPLEVAADCAVLARGLTRAFGERRALDGLDLSVSRGEILGLLGPNGAGKTTTIRILCTLLRPDAGSAQVLGLNALTQVDELRARIGVVPQDLAVYGGLSARENLRFFASLHGLRAAELEQRVERALEHAGLSDRADERVSRFSGGMKRRLNIVAACMHAPELLFLDEPTVGVDPQSRHRIHEMVRELRASGATIVYTTHALGEVEQLCDRIAIVDRGRIVAQGSLEQLRERHERERGELRSPLLKLLEPARAREAAELLTRAGIRFETDGGGASLEEMFLSMTGHSLRDQQP